MERMNEQGELRNEEEEQAEPEVLREEPQSPPVRRYPVRNRLTYLTQCLMILVVSP